MNHDVLVSVLTSLLVISEALGGMTFLTDNSIYQVIVRILKVLFQTVTGKPSPAQA